MARWMIVLASGSITAVVGTAMTATAVTATVLGPSGASQFARRGSNITVSPPRQACSTNGQTSRNQHSNSAAWRRIQNSNGGGFGGAGAGLGTAMSSGSKKVMSSAAAVPIVTSATRFTAIVNVICG